MEKEFLKYFGEGWKKKEERKEWASEAVDLVSSEQFEEAIDKVKEHTTDFWDDQKAASYSIMGLVAHTQKQFDKALLNYSVALKITNDTRRIHDMIPDLLLAIALIFIQKEMFVEAKETLVRSGVKDSKAPWFLQILNLYKEKSGITGDEIMNEINKQVEENKREKKAWLQWIKENVERIIELATEIAKRS